VANYPLAGFTILDLTQFYQGPYATMMLAKAGADVIKIEPPGGESLRRLAVDGKETSMPVAMLNANKRGVTLNLKSDRGKALLRQLTTKADALVENYAPGVMDRLGVGFSVLHKVNPKLVYASATGFGLSGPDRDNLAMDFTVQAASGVMSTTGYADGPPLRTGAPYVDILGGAHLHGALMMGLLERERTGVGRLVEVAMVEAMYPSLATVLDQYHNAGREIPPRSGNAFANHNRAPYNVYEAADGHVAIILVTEGQWQNLLRAMGREDLKDDQRFLTNDDRTRNFEETEEVVRTWTRANTRADIFAATSEAKVPCAPVRDIEEVMLDPHMHERGSLEWVDHYDYDDPVVLPNSALRVHGANKVPTAPSPRVGEHNRDIYGGLLNLSDVELEELDAEGVI
jgi:CoA:oxalate CoA-transferase